jgi:hypothetical protein
MPVQPWGDHPLKHHCKQGEQKNPGVCYNCKAGIRFEWGL